jgi:hypothetical protein
MSPAVDLLEVGVDVWTNSIRVGFGPADVALAARTAPHLSATLGVPVQVALAALPTLQDCTNRDHCYSPMKTGIRVRQASPTSSIICTMGFHVTKAGDPQRLTAGHCIFTGVDNWYHRDYPVDGGLIGLKLQSLYPWGGHDAGRVDFSVHSASQISTKLYGNTRTIIYDTNPVNGEVLCASLGMTNQIQCGTVTSARNTYVDPTYGSTLTRAQACCYSTTAGDSGSPIYKDFSGTSIYAKGTHIGSNGSTISFTLIIDVLNAMGLALYT